MSPSKPSSSAPPSSARGERHAQTRGAVEGETEGLLDVLGLFCDALPAKRGTKYKNAFDLVVREGETFRSAPLTEREAEIVRNAMGRKQFQPKLCFYNAQRLVLADPTGELEYVEGYTMDLVHHAWVALGSKVVDLTLRHGRERRPILGVLPRGHEYVGVRLSRPYLRDALQRRSGVCFLDDGKTGYPILRDDPSAWKSKSPR